MTVYGKDKRGLVEELRKLRTRLDGLERRNAEIMQIQEALQESVNQFKAIFDNTLIGLYRTTPNGRILMANSALLKMLGYSSFDQLAQRNLEQGGYEPQYLRSAFKECIEDEGKIVGLESTWKKSDGTTLYVRENAQAVRDESGNILYYQGTVEDITEHKQTKMALQSSEQMFEALVANMSEGVDIVDENLRCVFANPAGEEIFGVGAGGLVGHTLHEFVSDEGRCCIEEQLNKRREGMGSSYDLEIIRPDGRKRQLIVSGAPRFSEDGKYLGAMAIFFDVTKRKESEEALRKAHDELEMRVRERTAELQQANEALLKSENRYRTVIENAGEGIVVVQDDMLRFINSRHTFVTGRSQEESMSRPFIEFVHPDDRQRVAEVHTARLRGEHVPSVYEFRIIDKNGRTKWLENNGVLIEWNGKPASLNFLRDITARKNAEEALREREEMIRAMVETSRDWIWSIDLNGVHTYCNPAVEQILGYSPDELIGNRSFDLIHDDDRRTVEANLLAWIAEKRGWSDLMLRWKHKDGTYRCLESNAVPILSSENKLVGFRGIDRDITGRKRAEESLRESEERFRKVFEEGPIGMVLTSRDLKFFSANPAFCKMLGYTAEEMSSKTFLDVTHPAHRDADRENVEKMWRGEIQHYMTEKRYLAKNSDIRWGRLSTSLIRGRDGEPCYALAMVEDITEHKRAEEALQASEARYADLYENAPDMYVSVDAETASILSCNRTLAQTTGYDKEEIIGKPIFEMYHPDCMEEVQAAFRQFVATGEVRDKELQLRCKDGSKIEVSLKVSAVRDASGKILYSRSSWRDITERKRAEEALKESEEKFRSLAEYSPNMIFINKEGRIVYINNKCEEVMGYTKEYLCSPDFDFRTLIAPESLNLVIDNFARHLRGEDVQPYDYSIITKNGKRIEAINSSKLIHYEGQKAILGVVTDITERKKSEQALRESEERLKILFESAPDAIYLIDSDGMFVDGNRAALELVGYARDEVIGRSLSELDLLSAEQLSKAEVNLRKVVAGKLFSPNGYTLKRKDGSYVSVEVRTFPVKIAGKMLTLGIARDVTEHKQTEKKLLEHQAELKSLASQLSLTEERERHRLATDLHDQISQSLVISKIKLDQLCKSSVSSEFNKPLEDISKCLGQIIDDTRALTFDLSYPILYELGFEAAVAEWLTDQVQEKHGIETEFVDDGHNKPLDDDIRVLLFRNVRELLINVVKHARAHKARVVIHKVNKHIQVTVEDNGVGFDPVEVASTAAKRAEFGLFSIRERLEQLGGQIEIDSNPGHGSKITMTAPLKYGKSAHRTRK